MEGYSIHIGTASTLYCRRAKIIRTIIIIRLMAEKGVVKGCLIPQIVPATTFSRGVSPAQPPT